MKFLILKTTLAIWMTSFLNRASNVIFAPKKKDNIFERCRLADILENIEKVLLSRLMTSGVQSDISQVALKIRRNCIISTTSRISVTLRIFAKIILHIVILI